MKVLPKAAAFIAAAVIALAPVTIAAGAETTEYDGTDGGETQTLSSYARATSREAYFCTSADLATGIFAVPYTYCVEILSEEGDWYRVKYAEDYGIYRAVYGYVQKSDFEVLSEAPQTVFLYKSVSVTFSQDAPAGNLPVIDDITVTAAFYGSYYSGAAGYSYVLCDDSFGYIVGANEDYPLILPEDDAADTEDDAQPNNRGTVVASVVIGALALLALALLVLSGKKRPKHTHEDPFGN